MVSRHNAVNVRPVEGDDFAGIDGESGERIFCPGFDSPSSGGVFAHGKVPGLLPSGLTVRLLPLAVNDRALRGIQWAKFRLSKSSPFAQDQKEQYSELYETEDLAGEYGKIEQSLC